MKLTARSIGLVRPLLGLPILAALLALAGLGGLLLVHRWCARSGVWVIVAASLARVPAPATKGALDAHTDDASAR